MVEMTRTKDIDGARNVEWHVDAGSVFMWGRGFSYEFDRGIFEHQMRRLLEAAEETERAPH